MAATAFMEPIIVRLASVWCNWGNWGRQLWGHAGARDFTRFTHLGHRRLFRNFVEVDSGPASGPGAAFAWACQAFVMSFLSGKLSRRIAAAVTRVGLFWLKYADLVLIKRPGAFDASAAYYFLGLKGGLLPDSQLLDNYRGAQV